MWDKQTQQQIVIYNTQVYALKIDARWNHMHAKQLRKEGAVHIEFFSQTHYFMFFFMSKKRNTQLQPRLHNILVTKSHICKSLKNESYDLLKYWAYTAFVAEHKRRLWLSPRKLRYEPAETVLTPSLSQRQHVLMSAPNNVLQGVLLAHTHLWTSRHEGEADTKQLCY